MCLSCERRPCVYDADEARIRDEAHDAALAAHERDWRASLAPEPRTVADLLDAAGIPYEVEHRCPMCGDRNATGRLCRACDDDLNAMGRDDA